MLVEDEFDTREMVAESLEQSGATVLLAASGPEALRVLARQTPDVLVSDIGMPEMACSPHSFPALAETDHEPVYYGRHRSVRQDGHPVVRRGWPQGAGARKEFRK